MWGDVFPEDGSSESCLPKYSSDKSSFKINDKVEISGLVKAAAFNGCHGEISSCKEETGRFCV
jgi:hypothetical protein